MPLDGGLLHYSHVSHCLKAFSIRKRASSPSFIWAELSLYPCHTVIEWDRALMGDFGFD